MSELINDKTILFFDSNCLLCDRTVILLARLDRSKRLSFASFRSQAAKKLLPELADRNELSDSIVLWHRGVRYCKSEAVVEVIKLLPFPMNWCRCVKIIPRRWRDTLYDVVAKNRYRWFGATDRCELLQSPWKDRIVL